MNRVTLHAAKSILSRLIARGEAGEEIVLMRGKVSLDAGFFEPLPDSELAASE